MNERPVITWCLRVPLTSINALYIYMLVYKHGIHDRILSCKNPKWHITNRHACCRCTSNAPRELCARVPVYAERTHAHNLWLTEKCVYIDITITRNGDALRNAEAPNRLQQQWQQRNGKILNDIDQFWPRPDANTHKKRRISTRDCVAFIEYYDHRNCVYVDIRAKCSGNLESTIEHSSSDSAYFIFLCVFRFFYHLPFFCLVFHVVSVVDLVVWNRHCRETCEKKMNQKSDTPPDRANHSWQCCVNLFLGKIGPICTLVYRYSTFSLSFCVSRFTEPDARVHNVESTRWST